MFVQLWLLAKTVQNAKLIQQNVYHVVHVQVSALLARFLLICKKHKTTKQGRLPLFFIAKTKVHV
jgi:hypothetical protein